MHKVSNTHTPSLELYPLQLYVADLETLRNKYALRLQKGIAEQIVKHKHARPIYLYLELKPLFSSGVIFSDRGVIPYKKIAEYIGESVPSVRRKIAILKRLKLVTIDSKRNICLSSLKILPNVLKIYPKTILTDKSKESRAALEYKTFYFQKYKLKNNGKTHLTIKQIAIYENLNRQRYRLEQKIYEKELVQRFYESNSTGLNSKKEFNFTTCEKHYRKSELKKFRKHIRENIEAYKTKYQKIYDANVLQIEFGKPYINPTVTLSSEGAAKVLGYKSPSSAWYELRKLATADYIEWYSVITKISDRCPAIYEQMSGQRSDIFSYKYNTRKTTSGRIEKYFKREPNLIIPNEKALFFL
jgi:hypothetical protein